MSKIGVIFCAWNTEDMLTMSLSPWLEARKQRLGGHDFVIAAVSVPFEGFSQEGPLDDTTENLVAHRVGGLIDHVITPMVMDGEDDPRKWKETEARGAALTWLVSAGTDWTIQADSDEGYTIDEIQRICAFVEARPHVPWFRGSLRNAVFTKDQYLVEPFTPARIHRSHVPGLKAARFWDDNNVEYECTAPDMKGVFARDLTLPSARIPKSVAWVKHMTWLNDSRSRLKILYQTQGRKWPSCSFAWDDSRGGLVWNEEHFRRTGQPIPEVAHD